ncbi:MAG TPA: SMC-Scp complex subunit ScpB, partial [Candidatus Subteraquimicrobiales bacterium]
MKPLKGIVESLLFVADKPLSAQKLAEITEVEPREINKILKELLDENRAEYRGFLLRKVAGGYRFYAQPRYHA